MKLCQEVLTEDHLREQAEMLRARDETKAARREERLRLIRGRQGRFSELPAHLQAIMYAESHATDARAGWRAYGEALKLQADGKPIPVPWLFETELLHVSDMWELARQGLIAVALAEEAERQALREGW
jgi:hypothetical protein